MGVFQTLKNTVAKSLGMQRYYVGGNRTTLADITRQGVKLNMDTFYELYRMNRPIRDCTRAIAKSVGMHGIYLVDKQQNVLDNEQLDKETLGMFTDETFLKWKIELYKNYFTSGELYIVPEANAYNEVIRFKVLDSRQVLKRVDNYGNIFGFKITDYYGVQHDYTTDDVAYFKYEDSIDNSNDGMSILYGIVYDALCDMESMKSNYSYYTNSAMPSSLLMIDGTLSDDEQQKIKDQFEAQFRGSSNAHKNLVIGGALDFKTLSISNKDMDFINQRYLSMENICSAYGVNKFSLGYSKDTNYSNGENLRREYVDYTVNPLSDDLENILNTLMMKFRPDFYLKYDIKVDSEHIDDVRERNKDQRDDIDKGIITINEARVERGLDPYPDESANKPLTSRNTVLLEDIALDAVLPTKEE